MPCARPSVRKAIFWFSSRRTWIHAYTVYTLFMMMVLQVIAHPQHVDHSDAEIDDMSIDNLLHVEHDLRNQNAHVDKHVASLHGRLEKLRVRQATLEKTRKKVGAARDYEVKQRRTKERELDRAHAQLQAKKAQIVTLQEQSDKLRARIREMSTAVLGLNQQKHNLEDEYAHPSLQTAFLNDATRIGPVTQHVANKTVAVIFPELRVGLEEAGNARRMIQNGPTITSLFTSFVLYLFAISLAWCLYRLSRKVSRRMTMARMLFSADMAFATVWAIVCLGYIVLVGDPLQQFADTHSGISLMLHLSLMACLISNVLLRCFHLSTNPSFSTGVELFCVIFVAQHFYQGVWHPLLFDESVRVGFGAYFGYLIVNGGLAVYRARVMDRPVAKLRMEFEEVDGLMKTGEWLREKAMNVWSLCEEWLTKGAVDYDDVESIGKNSWRPMRRNDKKAELGATFLR